MPDPSDADRRQPDPHLRLDAPCSTPACDLNRIPGGRFCWRCEDGVPAQPSPQLRFGDAVYGATVQLDETESIDNELAEYLTQ